MPRALCPLWPLTFGIRWLVVCLGVCAMSAPARAAEQEPSTQSPEHLAQECADYKASSCLALARLYEQGRGGLTKDVSLAARIYEKTCTGGTPQACDKLGDLYEAGRGVKKDERRAASLYEEACRGGVARGCNNLGILYQEGRGLDRDERRAAGLYEEACTANYLNACVNLGILHLHGMGVEKNERRAAALFDKACKTTNRAPACSDISTLQSTSRQVTPVELERAPFPESPPERQSDEKLTLRLLLTLGGQVGGDMLLEVDFTDGSRETLGAGDAGVLGLGVMVEPFGGSTHLLQLQAAGALNVWSIGASNASARWMHWSWELLGFYAYQPLNLRIGGGFQLNTGITFQGDGGLRSLSVPFDDALGLVVQADWTLPFAFLYVRYTSISYRPTGAPVAIAGNSFGFGVSFPLKIL